MSLIQLQKHRNRTAAALLAWFIFCVCVLCSGTFSSEPVKANESNQHAALTQHMGHESQMETSHTQPMAEHSCCDHQAVEHDMVKLISSNSLLLSIFATLVFALFPLILMFSFQAPAVHGATPFKDPPPSGYPPLFLTTQRLLN